MFLVFQLAHLVEMLVVPSVCSHSDTKEKCTAHAPRSITINYGAQLQQITTKTKSGATARKQVIYIRVLTNLCLFIIVKSCQILDANSSCTYIFILTVLFQIICLTRIFEFLKENLKIILSLRQH